jgi:hypothetical protein
MEPIRVTSSVRRIVALRRDENGRVAPVTLFRRRGDGRRKQSKYLRPIEKMTRRWANAQRAAADSYLSRHNRSNTKKKDGWIRDYNYNVSKAADRGRKQLKLRRLPTW